MKRKGKCGECGKPFTWKRPGEIGGALRRYCSEGCRKAAIKATARRFIARRLLLPRCKQLGCNRRVRAGNETGYCWECYVPGRV